MHPRAIVGPPGTLPMLTTDGMPQLRRSSPGRLQPMQVPSTSVPVDAPPIQANPSPGGGRSRVTVTRPGSAVTVRGVVQDPVAPVPQNPVSVGACFPKFDPIQMYGVGQPPQQMMQANPMQPNPMQPNQMANPMQANQMQPNPMQPNPMQPLPAGPGIDPGTGMPRLRGSRNLR